MQPGPDTGDTVRSSPATTAPELTYNLNFTTTGTYYVWVRAWAPDARGKAMFVALDTGAATGISAGGGASRNAGVGVWSWSNTQRTAAVTLTAGTIGVHTFHLWMGDDGVIIDKIVLTTDPNYVPVDLGPPVSGASGLQSAMA
jgi:hypothetical protein